MSGKLSTSTSAAAAAERGSSRQSDGDLFVVALGASAGGLQALEQFFDSMPADSGLAFVVVQHLSPNFKSLMDELLARHTQLAIRRVEDGMPIEPNAIYLIPPKKDMIASGGRLLLTDRDSSRGLSLPIDTFMRSLAQDFGRRAIGVILSGTGSDGSRGIRALHDAGGLVIVQDEESANFDGMPKSAIHTGVVDAILPPHEMADAILRHVRAARGNTEANSAHAGPISDDGIGEIFGILNEAYGVDFSNYKLSTVARRVERRLQFHRSPSLREYAARVRHDAEELNSLYKDLLIGVTRFFRDEEAFARLERDVIPQIIRQVPPSEEIRVWVAGCATGDEAYSIALLLHEALSEHGRPMHVKIFATDVHQESLAVASMGVYPEESVGELSPERLDRYFLRQESGYQVSPELRKLIVFAPHNVVKDAPFTKLHLICCRNLLIYLQPQAQTKALSLFHFALKTGGYLFLGPSESPGEVADEFDAVDRHWKIYRKRRDVRLAPNVRMPLSAGYSRLRAITDKSNSHSRTLSDVQLMRALDGVLSEYAPPSVLVNDRRKLIHSFGGAGKFLRIPDGKPPEDLLDLVDADLKVAVAGALQKAAKENQAIAYGSVGAPSRPEAHPIRISARPMNIPGVSEKLFLISFEAQPNRPPEVSHEETIEWDQVSRDRLKEVEEELRYAKENLQATIEEMETTNEELQAANEELVASNEELQSTNEELHSVNEELYTVNAEHQRKITELTELTDDMNNLLRSTDVGTIFLDRELRIRKFTPKISHAFQILPQDVGRSIEAFSHNIVYDELLGDVKHVLNTGQRLELDVQDRHGNWFLLRILPYQSGDAKDQVDGVVVTLIDISARKQAEQQLRRMSKVFMDGADPIMIEDLDGRIIDLNVEAERAYGWKREELLGRPMTVVVPPDYVEFERELRERCRTQEGVRNVEAVRQHRNGRLHPILLTLSRLSDENGEPIGIATISKDIEAQKDAELQARQAARKRDEFLAMLSHELRNPLGAVMNATRVLDHQSVEPEAIARACGVIRGQTRQMAALLDDLLDVARFTQGKIELRKEVVDIAELVQEAIEAVRPQVEQRGHTLEVDVRDRPVHVEGDRARLLQIQENLLANSAKYTPQGGIIRLSAMKQGDEAVIQIQDNGRGIPREMLESIFDLFVQGNDTVAREEGGMGVGLSLVHMLVMLHGGKVSAHSEGPGKGSTFTVRLPLTERLPSRKETTPPDRDLRAHVVLVEDNEDSRQMLSELLRLDGYEISAAADGITGCEMILDQRPDVALIDLGLPGMDGYEVARRVRSALGGNKVRLVALTGYGRAEDHRAVLEAGFDEHLVKPVDPDDLVRVLRKPR